MAWFNKHLNTSFLLAWLISYVLIWMFYLTTAAATEDNVPISSWFLLAAAILVTLSTEIWYLKHKNRSLFFMFLNLISWIGFLILLGLENKKTISPPPPTE